MAASTLGLILGFLAFAGTVSAASGDLDPGFGEAGKVTTDFAGGYDPAHDVAIQPNGKAVVVGATNSNPFDINSSDDFALARYEVDGSLDQSFGDGGKVTTDFGDSFDQAEAVAVQDDGKVVVAGVTESGSGDFALARYAPDGTLDQDFGNGGKVRTDFGGSDFAYALALQSDGKAVVAGFSNIGDPSRDFALARYDTDGTLDQDFGNGGKVRTDFVGGESPDTPDSANAVTIQPDGKIVAAGYADNNQAFASQDFALARYDTDGALDPDFGNDGKVMTDLGYDSEGASGLVVQPDGRVIAAGYSESDFALVGYDSGGALDESFGDGGETRTDFDQGSDRAFALAAQSDGKLIAAGASDSGSSDFALARYDTTLATSNSAPVARSKSVAAREDTPRKITLRGSDADGDGLTFRISDAPRHGTLSSIGAVSCAGTVPETCTAKVTYRPDPDFNDADSFGFRVNDGNVNSAKAIVSVSVRAVNDAPVARNDFAVVGKNDPVEIIKVLANDSDPEGDRLSIEDVTRSMHGKVWCSNKGLCIYLPDRGFRGADAFTYKAGDGTGRTDTATVRLRVR